MTLHFQAEALVVRWGESAVSVVASWDGPDLSMTINPAFVAEVLDLLVGPDVVIAASDALLPLTLRSADTGTFTVLTMPIRPIS